MAITGVYFIPSHPNTPTSLATLVERLRAVYGDEATPMRRWTLEHKLMRDTLSCLPAPAHAPNTPPKPRYLQFLSLSHYPGHGFVYASEPPSLSETAATSNVPRIPPPTSPTPAAMVMRTIPPTSGNTLFQHFTHACEPLWCHRHTVCVPTGIAYDVGDFRIRMGDVRQTQPTARVRGTVVEIEWTGPSLISGSLPSLYDDKIAASDTDNTRKAERASSDSTPDLAFIPEAADFDNEYTQTAQLIREFWARFGMESTTGVREAILVPDVGKEAKAERKLQCRRNSQRQRGYTSGQMRGDNRPAAGGSSGFGWGEQDDDPDPHAGVDLARQYMEIFRFNR